MDIRVVIFVLASLAPVAYAQPAFAVANQAVTTREFSQENTTVAGIPVINAPSLSLNDITFNDPSNLFKAVILRVELNGVVQNYIQIQVAAPLQIDSSPVTVTVALRGTSMVSTVIITIQQTNYAPYFASPIWITSLDEDTPVGTTVFTVLAFDFSPFNPSDAAFEYRIQDPSSVPQFSIDPITGYITLAEPVDFDMGDTGFSFIVEAIETESSAVLSATSEVEITVNNVDDNSPQFSGTLYQYTILENTGAALHEADDGTEIVTATDGDVGEFGEVTYALSGGGSLFDIDVTSGGAQLRTTGDLDREDTSSYTMALVATDTGGLSDTATLVVVVADANDHRPVITNSPLTSDVLVPECELDERLLSTVTASDQHDIGDYSLVAFKTTGGDFNHIVLDEESGTLSLGVAPVDYEVTSERSFTLSVKAIDNPRGQVDNQLESEETFVQTITITDCNDNPPVFSSSMYEFTITENTANLNGSIIYTTDGDATAANQAVYYHITADPDPGRWFEIAADGTVSIRSGVTVDREHTDVLTDSEGNGIVSFIIEAVNEGTRNDTLYSVQDAQVTVTIRDQNDNAPTMDQNPLTGTKSIVVVEDVTVGTVLAVVRATDPDVGENAVICYGITSGNDLGKFSLDETTGVLTLNKTIDYEMEPRSYTITITAINPPPVPAPPPSDDDDIMLTIMIEQANEHAPVFGSNRYDVDISEYNVLASAQQHSAGDIIATVSATDEDANDAIEYSITGGNEDDVFELTNPSFGNIVLKDPTLVDFEGTTSYALLITATDLVVPESDRRTTTTYLYIAVIDENDNLPVFSSDMYTGHVDEEQPTGTRVILSTPISVTDTDSLNGMETTTFEINTVGSPLPSPFLAFTLSVDGTTLTTMTPIDREEDGDVFTFQMIVRDAAGNQDTAMMTVDINDINDNTPEIREPPGGFVFMVAENNPVNSEIVNITAVDVDLGANADILFTLQGGAGYFDINHISGLITQVSSLQALEPPMIFTLTVIARDSGGLSSSRELIVNLTYSNDHTPEFESSVYSGSLPECADGGTPISPPITIRATDEDTNSVVTYYVEDSTEGDLFQLVHNGQTADILSADSSAFDREIGDTHTFTVYATDGIIGSEDDSATVTIFISDCNDHNPIFTQDLYDVDVPEGTASGTTVIQVHTNDADIGVNEEVRFDIETVAPPLFNSVFRVDTETGGIVTIVDIDNTYTGSSACSELADHSNNATLTIIATDQATVEEDRLSSTTTVVIRLLDRNSEAPSFVPSSFYHFEISENMDGVDLGTVEAIDECDMDSDVTFFLVSSQDSDPFIIDPDTGVIRVVSGLDREENDLLVIQLQAVDDGTDPGPQTGYASVTINVLDENDNAPKLVRDTFDVTLPENTPVGTTLISVVASDPDQDENGMISFTIISGDTDMFMLEGVGSESDHLITKLALDREEATTHTVTILVRDAGSPQRNTTAFMTLTVTDVNDNEPIWTAGHGSQFDIFENVSSILIVDLDATDADAGLNRELVYYFVDGSQDFEQFHIDRSNGSLYVASELDYETTQEYTLNIVVSDRRGETNDDGLTPLTNSTTVLITVKDINDNEPYFNRCPHKYEILESMSRGAVVGSSIRGSVVDEDSLAIQTPFYYYIDSLSDISCFGPFCIDVYTGDITLEGDIDFETTQMYTFYVVVSDMPNLTPNEVYNPPRIDLCDTVATEKNRVTRVDVILVDVNDQTPVFDTGSLLAAVAEESEFDTTVTILRALDTDVNTTYSTVYYEIIAVEPPYLVNRETGEVTTADTFTGRSGEIDRFTVVAYDNLGNEPSFTSTAILTIRVFKECEQIVVVADQKREEAETCRTQLETAIANQTGYIIYITKIRVHQNEDLNTVDTTKADMIFYALHHITGDLVPPEEVIGIIERGLDLQEDPIKSLVDNCLTNNFKQFCTSSEQTSASTGLSTAIGVSMGVLAVIILTLLICLVFVCALERRKARKLRMRKNKKLDHSSNFAQFSQLGTSNPIWIPPYENWEEESTTTANQSALDTENPIYESQELTIEMFKEDDMLSVASSRGNLSKVKPPRRSSTPGAHDSVYDDYDPLADALGISEKPEDSQTSLI